MTRSLLSRRLPGVSFLEPPRAAPSPLPPLDVAAFVGFAERGPLDLPVALDDAAQYAAVFGGDLPLASEERGQVVYAHLVAAVRSFFANGGRRCYVVRVAGPAPTAARFALPGVVALDVLGFARPALVEASSEGRWGDRLRLATRLAILPLPAERVEVVGAVLRWEAGADPFAVERGDVLRLTAADDRQWLVPVAAVRRPAGPAEPLTLETPGAFALTRLAASPPVALGPVERLGPDGPATLALVGTAYADDDPDEGTVLELRGADVAVLRQGDLLELALPDGRALFHVADLRQLGAGGEPPAPRAEARGGPLLRLPAGPLPVLSPPGLQRVERLRFDLLLQLGDERRPPLTDLAFGVGGRRFWGDLVLLETSAAFDRAPGSQHGRAATDRADEAGAAVAAARAYRAYRTGRQLDADQRRSLDRAALAGLLAPVPGSADDENAPADPGVPLPVTYLPVGVPGILGAEEFRGPLAAGDDDLAELTVDPFLDDRLRDVSPARLLAEAWDLAYVQERRLRGLHSLLTLDAVALVSVPDAVHRPWALAGSPPAPEPQLPLPTPPAEEPCPELASPFLACDRPPTLGSVAPAFGATTGGQVVTLTGSGFLAGPMSVQIGGRSAGGVVVTSDTQLTCLTPPSGVAGPVAVVVTNRHGTVALPDSFTYVAESTLPELPSLLPLVAFDLDPLLTLHEAVLRIGEARRDLVGLLSLPAHFERQDCLDWQDAFRSRLGLPRRGVAADLADLADLSFVAVYHPWVLLADATPTTRLRLAPPDGAVAGMVAARERRRGVWVAPANVPLQGVLGLAPDLDRDDWAALFEAQVNVLRREASDVRAMSAHTLSDERALLQLSVRRLMILLRKLAAERGMDVVFESNHERFREGVAVMLRGVLRGLFERGAFAGATPEQSYRVVTDASVNPRQDVDAGRFVALVQVAPAQPAELITVALTRSDEGGLHLEEV